MNNIKAEELPSPTTAMAISRTDLSTISHTHFLSFGSHLSIASGDSDRFSAVLRDSRLIAVKKLGFAHDAMIARTDLCAASQ